MSLINLKPKFCEFPFSMEICHHTQRSIWFYRHKYYSTINIISGRNLIPVFWGMARRKEVHFSHQTWKKYMHKIIIHEKLYLNHIQFVILEKMVRPNENSFFFFFFHLRKKIQLKCKNKLIHQKNRIHTNKLMSYIFESMFKAENGWLSRTKFC